VRDDLPSSGRVWMVAIANAGGHEFASGIMQLPQEPCYTGQGVFGPGIGRQPMPAAGLPLRIHRHVAIEKREDFAMVFDAEEVRRTAEPDGLQVVQVLVYGRRPRPHRAQQQVTAATEASCHPPGWKRNLIRLLRATNGHHTSIVGRRLVSGGRERETALSVTGSRQGVRPQTPVSLAMRTPLAEMPTSPSRTTGRADDDP
jgi:hypothetical protein